MQNSAQLQTMASKACFSTDYQIKSEAQQQFMALVLLIPPKDYPRIMENYSQTVLFVFSEFLNKNLSQLSDHQGILATLDQVIRNWYCFNDSFVRPDKQPLEKYVENSVALLMGNCMKINYLKKDGKAWILGFIKSGENSRYQLHLWKYFIDTVGYIDLKLGFLSYRSLIYSFQEEVIPEITQSLFPFFLSVEDTIKIQELSWMQAHLSVEDSLIERQQTHRLLFTPEEVKFNELIFSLLKEIVSFNYNITYSEYDYENTFDCSLVTFPECVLSKIISSKFIDSLYFVLFKLLQEMPTSSFLDAAFDALKKILMAKTVFTAKDAKNEFIRKNLTYLQNLLNMKANLSPLNLQKTLECQIKFLHNIQVHELKNVGESRHFEWFKTIGNIVADIIAGTPINCQNMLLITGLELVTQIVSEIISPQIKDQQDLLMLIADRITKEFLKAYLMNEHNLLGNVPLLKIKQFRKASQAILIEFKKLAALSYTNFFQSLAQASDIVFKNGHTFQIINFFLLITEIATNNYIERNIIYEEPTQASKQILGNILNSCFHFIGESYPKWNAQDDNIDSVILLFMQRILSETLGSLDFDEQIQRISIKSILFKAIKDQSNLPDDESFLIMCFQNVVNNLNKGNPMKIQYALQISADLIIKFKWTLKRDNFKKSELFRRLFTFFLGVSAQRLDGQFLKFRRRLARIVTTLSFDDILDSYRNSIDIVIERMKKELILKKPLRVLFDLMGICQAIDTCMIYRYFLSRFEQSIGFSALLNLIFDGYTDNPAIMKSLFKLSHLLIENKAQRFSHQKNAIKLYELLAILLPLWNKALGMCNSDDQASIYLQLARALNIMLKGYYINFFLLQQFVPELYHQFITLHFVKIAQNFSWISLYPKIYETTISTLLIISRDVIQVILVSPFDATIAAFDQMYSVLCCQTVQLLQKSIQEDRLLVQKIEKHLDIHKSLLAYMKNALKFKHKPTQLENIKKIILNREPKQLLLLELIKFGLGNGKNINSLMRPFCHTIFFSLPFYKDSLINILSSLGIDNDAITKFQHLADSTLKNESGDDFVAEFKSWIRRKDDTRELEEY